MTSFQEKWSGNSSKLLRELGPAWAIGFALIVGLVVYFVTTSNGDNRDSSSNGANKIVHAKLVSESELTAEAASLKHPVYWAGSNPRANYELTILADGSSYVRYLTNGAEAGDPRAEFLAVATYAVPDALVALERSARSSGAHLVENANGGKLLVSPDSPTSVYVVYPNSNYQIEVFDPSPKKALKVALSGDLEPVS